MPNLFFFFFDFKNSGSFLPRSGTVGAGARLDYNILEETIDLHIQVTCT